MLPPRNLKDKGFNQPPPAMKSFPECIVPKDSIKSYKNYYWTAKRKFSIWTKRPKPEWWVEYEISA
jgi:hypothetical protein